MHTNGSIILLVYAIGLIALGAFAAPLWTPAVCAFAGMVLSCLFVPTVAKSFAQARSARDIGGLPELLAGLYVMQVIYAAIPYGIGRFGRAIL